MHCANLKKETRGSCAWFALMDRPPPTPRNSYLVAVAISHHFNPAGDLPPPPAPFPAKPPSIPEALDGIAYRPAATSRMDGQGFIRGETCPRLLVGEPE